MYYPPSPLRFVKCINMSFISTSFTHPRFTSTYRSRTNGTGLLVATEDFGHTAVWDPQLSGDHTGSDAVMGHFHYFVSNMIWQWPSVDENSTELVHSTLTQRRRDCVKTCRAKKKKVLTKETTTQWHFITLISTMRLYTKLRVDFLHVKMMHNIKYILLVANLMSLRFEGEILQVSPPGFVQVLSQKHLHAVILINHIRSCYLSRDM